MEEYETPRENAQRLRYFIDLGVSRTLIAFDRLIAADDETRPGAVAALKTQLHNLANTCEATEKLLK